MSEDRGRARVLEEQALAMLDAEPGRAIAFEALGYEEGTHFSAGFAARVLEQLLSLDPEPERRARLPNNLAATLSVLGRREEALAAAAEAVNLYRRLTAERPDALSPGLAMSLNNLAKSLSELGRREDALAAGEEAADLYRRLAAERPDAFAPNFATSLNTLATTLSELGRREDALAAAEEAVDLHRRLAAERPDAFTPNLASSLNNLVD